MKYINLIIALLISTNVSLTAQTTSKENNPVMLENESKYTFAATIDTLSKHILASGWKVTTTHDLQETMKKNGKAVLPVKVMEICNPGLAYQILSRDDLRDVSPMLPCRISVYEKADGKTYISRMNAPAFAGMIGGDAAGTIIEAYTAAEEFVKTVTF